MSDAMSSETNSGVPSAAVGAAGDTAGVAAEQGRNVASTAAEQAKAVAGQATAQARSVTAEARDQAGRVIGDASSEFRQQMEQRLSQLVQSTRGASDQLLALHEGRTDESGQAGELARQASDKLSALAGRADELGVQGVAEEVANFARRRPLAFIGGALVAGVVTARLLRGLQAAKQDAGSNGATDPQRPALPSAAGSFEGREHVAPAAPTPAEVGSLDGPTGAVLPGETGLDVGGPVLGGVG